MGLFSRRRSQTAQLEERAPVVFPWNELLRFNGNQYSFNAFGNSGSSYLLGASGPVSTVLNRRVSIMGEARPTFQRFEKGKPSGLFSTDALDTLKTPWTGGTWRHLVAACESDVAASGNSYWVREGRELRRLDPDWVTIVTEAYGKGESALGDYLLGYIVQKPGHQPWAFEPGEVAHYRPGAPVGCAFRGESWLAAVASDASSDLELTRYKGNYLKNGAMPSLAVMYEPTIAMDTLEQFVPMFADKFTGSMNAGKVMHFLGGRDVKTVGATLDQLSFKAVQGAGETRIAAAAGVPATVAMFSEGMQGSSLNAGNYQASRRLLGDATIRPLLGALCDALAVLVPPPTGSRLTFDDSQVSFFQEDVTDEANIRQLNAATIRTLIEAGFEPDAAVLAVTTGNMPGLLGTHTGYVSVQLQQLGAGDPAPTPPEGGDNGQQPD